MGGNRATAGRRLSGREQFRLATAVEERPERDGFDQSDPVWRVPWLKGLRRPPREATWPRLMTVPHPAAVGSLGREFVRWAEAREGRPLRWWQRLVAARVLEVDDRGELVWDTLLLTVARQVGKSWLMRELILWRINQGDRFGEPQDVMHAGKDVAICVEVQRPARIWARSQPGYRVTEGNGNIQIERLEDGSRWLVRSKGGVYGYGVSVAAIDEAWKVNAEFLDEGVTPTMMERAQPQQLLISTAHRKATALMLGRRKAALEQLGNGTGDLLMEWSAPPALALDDVDGWRLASPHWTPQRQRLIAKQFEIAQSGVSVDPDEPDPMEAFKAQYLNRWPAAVTRAGDDLLPPRLWARLAEPDLTTDAPLFVAVEDDYGLGAAIAAAAPVGDGRIEVDGWFCRNWDEALVELERLGRARRIRHLQVGASMLNRMPPGTVPYPKPAGAAETRVGLALIRDLATAGQIVHNSRKPDLTSSVSAAQVRETLAGLRLVTDGRTDLVKALVWALNAAHKPTPEPAVS